MNSMNEFVKSKMQKIAKKVDEELPNNYGFIVLAFNFGEGKDNEMMYVSNANRQDVVKAMKEFIEKTEQNYGNDKRKIDFFEEKVEKHNFMLKHDCISKDKIRQIIKELNVDIERNKRRELNNSIERNLSMTLISYDPEIVKMRLLKLLEE